MRIKSKSDRRILLSDEITFEGTIESIIFNNPDNGYTVFSVMPRDSEDEDEGFTCVAYMADASEGEIVELYGSFVVHPSYGKQFSVKKYIRKEPTSLREIEKYLASGVIRGIREKLASKIVRVFKEETLHIIEEYPERLAEIKGINLEKALYIGETFKEQSGKRAVVMALQVYGISPAYAMKIYDKYKADTIDTIKTNPYVLADGIEGIGFKTADTIAFKIGFSKDDPLRILSGIKHVLTQASNNGHTCLPKDIFLESAAEILEAGRELIENGLIALQMDRSITLEKIDEQTMIFLNGYYYAESYVAKKLITLSRYEHKFKFDISAEIGGIEAETGFTLASQQKKAVNDALVSGVLVITGGPGTGKTTIINTILKLLEKGGYKTELAAPTGRAAKRITETTGFEAKTVHRLLGVAFQNTEGTRQSFEKNEENPIEADVLIIDESSMLDLLLTFNLLKAVEPSTKVIFVGDADQLPSVGPGNVLRDIISSGIIKTVKLDEIFRRGRESLITVNAHRINRGEFPHLNGQDKDFFLVKRANADDVADTIVDLVKNRLPSYYNIDSKKDIQLLSPMRKGTLGIVNLNQRLQKSVNPQTNAKNEKQRGDTLFREKDKVMHIKNNYNIRWRVAKGGVTVDEGEGVFNGDEGMITAIDNEEGKLTVLFDDGREVEYDFSQLDELELSYAVTVHKSQGSEYNTVIMPVHSGPYMLMNRNILYTAVTRAKKLVVLVGTEEALKKMIDNNREIRRFSALSHRLKKINGALEK